MQINYFLKKRKAKKLLKVWFARQTGFQPMDLLRLIEDIPLCLSD